VNAMGDHPRPTRFSLRPSKGIEFAFDYRQSAFACGSPGLMSWGILSRPYGTGSFLEHLPRTHVLGYSQPSLRDSIGESSSHAGLNPNSLLVPLWPD
jgi:hypothetical protein